MILTNLNQSPWGSLIRIACAIHLSRMSSTSLPQCQSGEALCGWTCATFVKCHHIKDHQSISKSQVRSFRLCRSEVRGPKRNLFAKRESVDSTGHPDVVAQRPDPNSATQLQFIAVPIVWNHLKLSEAPVESYCEFHVLQLLQTQSGVISPTGATLAPRSIGCPQRAWGLATLLHECDGMDRKESNRNGLKWMRKIATGFYKKDCTELCNELDETGPLPFFFPIVLHRYPLIQPASMCSSKEMPAPARRCRGTRPTS